MDFFSETSAVSSLFLHVLISGVFCIHLLFKDLMERLHLIFLFRVLYPKHLLHMLPWLVVGNCEQKISGSSEVSETNAERFQSSCSVSLLHSRQPKDLREMSGLI